MKVPSSFAMQRVWVARSTGDTDFPSISHAVEFRLNLLGETA